MAIIDFVRWEGDNKTFAWKFPHNNLSTSTKLHVAESQEAVLFSKGTIVQKFGPGTHHLNTENIPILRSLFGIPFGGKNPFTAEVWFVNKLMTLNIDWETKGMKIKDAEYNSMVPLIAHGRYGLKVVDAERFLVKLVGTLPEYTAYELTSHFSGELESRSKSAIMQFMMANNIGLTSISGYLSAISDNLKQTMLPFWEDYGFNLVGFYVTTIDVDETDPSGAKIADAMARQSAQNISGHTWQQAQVFETAQSAIENMNNGKGGGGLLGAVIAANMMGGMGAASGGAIMQPQPTNAPGVTNQGSVDFNNHQQGSGQPPVKEVFCSNCNKKFSSAMKFCPHCGDPYTPCPRCGTDNDSKAKRCVNCGVQLSAGIDSNCDNCKQPFPAGVAFCPSCGKPVSEGTCSRCGTPTNGMSFCPSCGNKVK